MAFEFLGLKMAKYKFGEMKTTVVIPTYNEEATIAGIINDCRKYSDEILVVSAKKSTDRTKEIAKKMGVDVIIDNGKGKGDAIRCAISYLKDGIAVFIDADGSHIPSDIPTMVKPIQEGKYDMVIASRMTGGSEELHGNFDQVFRLFASSMITYIINKRFGTTMSESQNGFRAMRVDKLKTLKLQANIFDIESEELMKFLKKGYKVGEIPSRELSRKAGKSGITVWKMGWVYAYRVFKNLF